MLRHLAVRIGQSAAIVFLVATLTFVLLHLAPGDPLSAAVESARIPPDVRTQYRRNFGLDRPLPEQYVRYLANLARGNLGYSFMEHRPVAAAIGERIPNTLLLSGAALGISFLLGVLVGAVQGARPGSTTDDLLSAASLTLYSLPLFWLGLMLVLVFALQLGWLPAGGAVDPALYPHLTWVGKVGDRLRHLALPAITLGLVGAAVTARFQRGAMADVIREHFVRAARAKGLHERTVLFSHALRNALLPTITLFGLAFPLLLSGSVLVETVFAWPGLGKFAVDAILRRDYPVVTGIAIITAVMVIVGNLLADALYRVADPRTRTSP